MYRLITRVLKFVPGSPEETLKHKAVGALGLVDSVRDLLVVFPV